MKAASIRWFLIAYSALLLVTMELHSGETVGVSATLLNSDYTFGAGAPPWSIAFGVVGIGLYFAVLFSPVSATLRPMPHLFRRWVAGLIDFMLALITPSFVIGLIAILIEYKQTGVFDWVIDRQEPRPWDWPLAIIGTFSIMFIFMPGYCAACWACGKPTPGSCIFGYRIASDDFCQLVFWKAYLRALLGGVALLAWPAWILAAYLKRDKLKGKFWLDVIFKTHAELL